MLLRTSLGSNRFSLNGEWTFSLDPDERGECEQWYLELLDKTIQVPGSWEEQGFGFPAHFSILSGWTKWHEYEGQAWYCRTVEIPAEWSGQVVTLTLKGVRWRSQVWIDGICAGKQESLSVPHRYDLTPWIRPGKEHHLAIQLNNRMLYSLRESHIHSSQTGTKWGGIAGGIELSAAPDISIQQIKCWPHVDARRFDFDIAVRGSATNLELHVNVFTPDGEKVSSASAAVYDGQASIPVNMGAQSRLWWDDDPFVYRAEFHLHRATETLDTTEAHIGLREIAVAGRRILLNGTPIFLRGYVDCCIFPQTGYPVWDVEHYRRQFRIAKSYGFNHVRLHSWSAPEPFWQAADELGMLVQTELPNWTVHYGQWEVSPPNNVHQFLTEELERIIAELHLHPSWVMLSNGNELIYQGAGHPRLLEMVNRAKALDPTRLYTDQTGFGQLPAPTRAVDFYIQSCNWHPPQNIYDAATNDTTQDFTAALAFSDRPSIAHEHGQFTMYVRPAEALKYTGAIRPTWLESIQKSLDAKELTTRIDSYIQASGTHLVRAYKENIERARRTEGLTGIQLLDIRDFPGQGHATTGILDMFWDSKGLITPEIFRQCNDAIVLLMRSRSRTVWNGQILQVQLEVSNFSRTNLDTTLHWELREYGSEERLTGQLRTPSAAVGEITHLGKLSIPLPAYGQARTWRLTVQIGEVQNCWFFWSFPYPTPRKNDGDIVTRIKSLRNLLPTAEFADNLAGTSLDMHDDYKLSYPQYQLAISDRLSLRLLQYLYDGGSVWLMPNASQLYDAVRTRYLPPFWSYLHFPDNVSSVMGMCIPSHPALGGFPHDNCSDWQWYALVNDIPAICLDSVPFIEPVVEVIDNFNRAKRLCYAFEARVGAGRLFVSTWRLYDVGIAGLPEGHYLFDQILSYLRSAAFVPDATLSVAELLGIFRLTNGLNVDGG